MLDTDYTIQQTANGRFIGIRIEHAKYSYTGIFQSRVEAENVCYKKRKADEMVQNRETN